MNHMQIFSPKNQTVLALRDDSANDVQTEGGLFIPNRAVELSNQGEVRAAEKDSPYAVGDRVVFTKYAGSEIELNGVPYLLLKEKEIQGTITTVNVAETIAEKNDQLQKALAQFEATGRG